MATAFNIASRSFMEQISWAAEAGPETELGLMRVEVAAEFYEVCLDVTGDTPAERLIASSMGELLTEMQKLSRPFG